MILPDSTWFLADTTQKKPTNLDLEQWELKCGISQSKNTERTFPLLFCSFVLLYYSLKNWLQHKNVDAQNCYL